MENQLKGGKIFLLIHGFRGFPPWLASSIAYRSVERQRCDGARRLTSCCSGQRKTTGEARNKAWSSGCSNSDPFPTTRSYLLSAISFPSFSSYEPTCQLMHRSNLFLKSITIVALGPHPQCMTFHSWLPKALGHWQCKICPEALQESP